MLDQPTSVLRLCGMSRIARPGCIWPLHDKGVDQPPDQLARETERFNPSETLDIDDPGVP